MPKIVLFLLLFSFTKISIAQYYFQDIITAEKTRKNLSLFQKNQIKTVRVTSIEPDGSETPDFGIEQIFQPNKNQLITESKSGVTGSSRLITRFNQQFAPVITVDSTANTINTVRYEYNQLGQLTKTESQSVEPGDTNRYTITESHIYAYTEQGKLSKMLKIKDRTDTTTIIFIPDENGLPGEEQWWRKNQKTETWYYYYDDNNRLTDIVRYHAVAKKMLPDYIFEYNPDGSISHQTVVQSGTNFYRVWVYEYLENGLKKAESILRKGVEQEGRVIYDYD